MQAWLGILCSPDVQLLCVLLLIEIFHHVTYMRSAQPPAGVVVYSWCTASYGESVFLRSESTSRCKEAILNIIGGLDPFKGPWKGVQMLLHQLLLVIWSPIWCYRLVSLLLSSLRPTIKDWESYNQFHCLWMDKRSHVHGRNLENS